MTWTWIKTGKVWSLDARQCSIQLCPRPAYCDRGRWQAYMCCRGFPTNPNPFDDADGFPRYYFDLDRAKAEIEDLLNFRGYHPLKAAMPRCRPR